MTIQITTTETLQRQQQTEQWDSLHKNFLERALNNAFEGQEQHIRVITASISHCWRYPGTINLQIDAPIGSIPIHTCLGKLIDYYDNNANLPQDEGGLSQDIDYTQSTLQTETDYDEETDEDCYKVTLDINFDS